MAVPDRVVQNSWFNQQLGEDVDTWLQQNLTIKERRWMTEGEAMSDFVLKQRKKLLIWPPCHLQKLIYW